LEKVTEEFSADVKVGASIPYFAFQGSASFRQYSEKLSSTYVKAYMARSIVGTSIIRLVSISNSPTHISSGERKGQSRIYERCESSSSIISR
jgi:hypothetical protein